MEKGKECLMKINSSYKKKKNEGQDFYLVVVAILYKLDKCCLLLLFLVNVGPCLPVEKELISFFNYVIK